MTRLHDLVSGGRSRTGGFHRGGWSRLAREARRVGWRRPRSWLLGGLDAVLASLHLSMAGYCEHYLDCSDDADVQSKLDKLEDGE